MRVRKQIGSNNDMAFGGGQQSLWVNVPDGPGQVAGTRLRLPLGAWFLDKSQGIDYRTKVLGKYTSDTRDAVIQACILGTPGITEIVAYSSNFATATRQFAVSANLNTAYGATTVATPV